MFPFTWEMKKNHSYRQFSRAKYPVNDNKHTTLSNSSSNTDLVSLHLSYLKTHSENNMLGQEF